MKECHTVLVYVAFFHSVRVLSATFRASASWATVRLSELAGFEPALDGDSSACKPAL